MILGLSHVGVTLRSLEETMDYYAEVFGFAVMSNAERKGEWIEKITGIPGFHTRIVYFSVAPHRQLETFQFLNPPPILPEKDSSMRAGILYCALEGKTIGGNPLRIQKKDAPPWFPLLGDREYPHPGRRVETLTDPNGLFFRVNGDAKKESDSSPAGIRRFLYPVVLVANPDESMAFYRDTLGMEVDSAGESPLGTGGSGNPKSLRWVLLKARTGLCLKLIWPLGLPVLPPLPWKMNRVGFTHIAFGVSHLDSFYGELLSKKVSFNSPPQSVQPMPQIQGQPVFTPPHLGGKVVYLTTPEGLTLEFIDSPRIQMELKDPAKA